jgi:hypothetical protein
VCVCVCVCGFFKIGSHYVYCVAQAGFELPPECWEHATSIHQFFIYPGY